VILKGTLKSTEDMVALFCLVKLKKTVKKNLVVLVFHFIDLFFAAFRFDMVPIVLRQ
jgi:hypothetical protein